ncbi:hypothetical protein ACEPAH_862 [Sanghuangporus vaninii]
MSLYALLLMAFTAEPDTDLRTSLLNAFSNLEAGRFVTTACLALSVYDYLITLSEEVTRDFIFIIQLLIKQYNARLICSGILRGVLRNRSFCLSAVNVFAWKSTAGIFFAQALAIAIVFVAKYLEGVDSFPGSVPGGGCIFTFANRQIFANFIFILVSETSTSIANVVTILVAPVEIHAMLVTYVFLILLLINYYTTIFTCACQLSTCHA